MKNVHCDCDLQQNIQHLSYLSYPDPVPCSLSLSLGKSAFSSCNQPHKPGNCGEGYGVFSQGDGRRAERENSREIRTEFFILRHDMTEPDKSELTRHIRYPSCAVAGSSSLLPYLRYGHREIWRLRHSLIFSFPSGLIGFCCTRQSWYEFDCHHHLLDKLFPLDCFFLEGRILFSHPQTASRYVPSLPGQSSGGICQDSVVLTCTDYAS